MTIYSARDRLIKYRLWRLEALAALQNHEWSYTAKDLLVTTIMILISDSISNLIRGQTYKGNAAKPQYRLVNNTTENENLEAFEEVFSWYRFHKPNFVGDVRQECSNHVDVLYNKRLQDNLLVELHESHFLCITSTETALTQSKNNFPFLGWFNTTSALRRMSTRQYPFWLWLRASCTFHWLPRCTPFEDCLQLSLGL